MKKRKKDTGLSLQASISEKEKRPVTSGFLAIVPVCYMILGVFGWMKTALGIINVVYDADLLYGVLLAAGIWIGILYLMKKRQFLLLLLTLAVTPILVWMRFSVILEGFSEISRVFQSGMTVPGGVYQGIGSEYEITCALIVVVFLLYDLFFICLSTEIGKYLAVLLLVLPFCAAFVFGQVPDAAVCTGTDRILRRRTRQAAKWQCFLSGDSIAAVALDRIFSRKIPFGAAF